jgi:hypothetical protein
LETTSGHKIAEAFSPADTEPRYAIGEAAKRAGVAVQTLRMYEQAGLLLPHKTASGRRRYSNSDLWILMSKRKEVAMAMRMMMIMLSAVALPAFLLGCGDEPPKLVEDPNAVLEQADCATCHTHEITLRALAVEDPISGESGEG